MKRFIYVVAPSGRVAHKAYGRPVEGPTACGRQMSKGWQWSVTKSVLLPYCARCEVAT